MSVSNMVKMGLVVGAMAVLTGCATQTVKANNAGVNLTVAVAPDVPNKLIDAAAIKEACLTKLKEKGIEQSETGTPVTLSIFNFKVIKGGGNAAFTAGSTGFALVDALNTALTVAQNVDTVAKNVAGSDASYVQTSIQYKMESNNNEIGSYPLGVQGKVQEQKDIYSQNLAASVFELVSK
jgi:hypothetical protein